MKMPRLAVIILAVILAIFAGTTDASAKKTSRKAGFNPDKSIVDFLKAEGHDSSKEARLTLATEHVVEGYDFSADKNAELLKALKAAKAKQVLEQKLAKETRLVAYLKLKGEDASKEARTILAEQHGIQGYDRSAEKNAELLNALKNAEEKVVATEASKQEQPKQEVKETPVVPIEVLPPVVTTEPKVVTPEASKKESEAIALIPSRDMVGPVIPVIEPALPEKLDVPAKIEDMIENRPTVKSVSTPPPVASTTPVPKTVATPKPVVKKEVSKQAPTMSQYNFDQLQIRVRDQIFYSISALIMAISVIGGYFYFKNEREKRFSYRKKVESRPAPPKIDPPNVVPMTLAPIETEPEVIRTGANQTEPVKKPGGTLPSKGISLRPITAENIKALFEDGDSPLDIAELRKRCSLSSVIGGRCRGQGFTWSTSDTLTSTREVDNLLERIQNGITLFLEGNVSQIISIDLYLKQLPDGKLPGRQEVLREWATNQVRLTINDFDKRLAKISSEKEQSAKKSGSAKKSAAA